MRLTLLGSGDTRQVPVYGCACAACARARENPALRRLPCCAQLVDEAQCWLIDAGLTDLCERFPPGRLSGILLTHYHADHAQGLLQLRWGEGARIPVYGPADPQGFADLYKHPGLLDFRPALAAFERWRLGGLEVTPLPLRHSKPTFGYLFENAEGRGASNGIAYLTDTAGLPGETLDHLRRSGPDTLVIDCSLPPQSSPARNHNDIAEALRCIDVIAPRRAVLTHIGHDLDRWLMENPRALPDGVSAARDNMCLEA